MKYKKIKNSTESKVHHAQNTIFKKVKSDITDLWSIVKLLYFK